MTYTLHHGDCLEILRTLPDNSVHCVVTSPPYWGLRDYGHDGQIGLEETPDAYVARLVDVFREVRRVLRDDGTVFLNLGDSYFGGKGENGNSKARLTADDRGYKQSGGTVTMATRPLDRPQDGLKPKDLVGIPWRVAFALQADAGGCDRTSSGTSQTRCRRACGIGVPRRMSTCFCLRRAHGTTTMRRPLRSRAYNHWEKRN